MLRTDRNNKITRFKGCIIFQLFKNKHLWLVYNHIDEHLTQKVVKVKELIEYISRKAREEGA